MHADDQAALVIAQDLALDDLVLFEQVFHRTPGHLLLGALIRKHDVPVGILGADDENRDLLAYLECFALLVVDHFKFTARDHTLRFRPNAHQDLAGADTGNGSLAYLTGLRKFHTEGVVLE